jgi:hypothetical protein
MIGKELVMTTPAEEPDSKPVPGERWSDEHPETHMERDDDRWSRRAQMRDWLIIIVMMVIYLIWAGLIYFLEPGIR